MGENLGMKIVEMPVFDLVPYENNPRNNDGAVDAVAASIREFGFRVPIIVDKGNVIVAGHTRLKAAEKLGLSSVPVIRADDLTEEQVKAFRLADNKVSEQAEWDWDLVDSEINDILELNMGDFGFIFEDDATPDEPKEKKNEQHKIRKFNTTRKTFIFNPCKSLSI